MNFPFTSRQFFDVFGRYNEAVWPMQVVLLGVAIAIVSLIFIRRRWAGTTISVLLAFLWGWLAVAYHALFFAAINIVAYGFAIVSLAGSAAFLWFGLIRRQLVFGAVGVWRAVTGSAFIAFSLAAYPVWSYQAGHPYPYLPTFGLPCPTTLFTIGVLAFLETPCPKSIFLVPVLWCGIGSVAALQLGVTQDLSLIPAGVAGVVLLVRSDVVQVADG